LKKFFILHIFITSFDLQAYYSALHGELRAISE